MIARYLTTSCRMKFLCSRLELPLERHEWSTTAHLLFLGAERHASARLLSQWMLHWWQVNGSDFSMHSYISAEHKAGQATSAVCQIFGMTRPAFHLQRFVRNTPSVFFLCLSEFFFYPLPARLDIGAGVEIAIRMSHRPEPSGRVVREGVDGLDSGGRHGRRFVLSHTHRLQRRPYPVCTGRSGNVRHRCGGGWAGPRFFLGGPFRVCVYRCLELKCGVLWGCPPTPRSINDLPTAPHVRCCCQKKNDELLCGGEEVACLRTYALG